MYGPLDRFVFGEEERGIMERAGSDDTKELRTSQSLTRRGLFEMARLRQRFLTASATTPTRPTIRTPLLNPTMAVPSFPLHSRPASGLSSADLIFCAP